MACGMLATAAFMGGCSGDDGAEGPAGPTGPAGPAGPEGPEGPAAPVIALESCGVCHDSGAFVAAKVAHAVTGQATVSNVQFAVDPLNPADLLVSYNLTVDGQNPTDFVVLRTDYKISGGIRSDAGANAPAYDPVLGSYTITIPGGVAAAGAGSRYFLRVSNGTSNSGVHAIVSGDYPAPAYADVVSDQSCVNCHGPGGVAPHPTFGYPAMVPSQCVVCHEGVTDGTAPAYENFFPASYYGFFDLIHGIHNSHNMPSGHYEFNEETIFSVTYPTYMNNCSVCHDDTSTLAAANGMTVSGANCFSCHESMEAFPDAPSFHAPYDETTDCASACHNPAGTAPLLADVTDFHNGSLTERSGIIWDGVDTSVTEGAKFDWQITGVVDDGTNLAISWTASYDGVGVNPCNATVGPGAPVFDGDDAGNLSMLRSYAQGDDFILGQSTSAPGQANAVNLDTTNTVCAGNVATTTIPVDAVDATVGRVALQGKPRVVSVADATATMQVRAKTPTYDWLVGSGDAATPRRSIVDTTGKCLKCHVGSLYQHGGNRVDNIDMCILCHNSASNEKNVRVDYGVDPSEAYDGEVGQTFEMKTMLHRIHSAGETGRPIVIYRGRGIYAWAVDRADLPNWPGEGSQPIFGSDDGTGNPVLQTHNFHTPTYPRHLYDCGACHSAEFLAGSTLPDQSLAVATTLDAGEEPWDNQIDDVLQGTGAASCTSCHGSSDARAHAYQNGWVPTEFPEGRQSILDAAN
jgi:OmcA/MtrC family decaheme c-type cytochrome